ncbi:MAG: sigma 54-interacting transcriptional regulator [Cyclobacteriaceae bacterium]|nr:sigma 54-interacting transcriptional regulator [Cyclobacteriaceae bacterium]
MIQTSILEQFKRSFESISLLTGELFFKDLVSSISNSLQMDGVWVTEYHKEQNSMTTMAFFHSGHYVTNFTYLIDGTPCEKVINSQVIVHYSEKIYDLFPSDHKMLNKFKGESYAGAALHDDNGEVIGSIALMNSKPLELTEDISTVIKIIKSRAEAELQRLKREREIIQRENLLRGLINGVQDLLINLNQKGQIVMLNSTAESMLGLAEFYKNSYHISTFLNDGSKSKLITLIESISTKKSEDGYVWIPGSLTITPLNGETFDVEGTLSRYELDNKVYFTLVVRSRDDKAESKEKIKQLIDQTEYLREELEDIKQNHQLIGESNPVKRLLQNVYMVAHTDATVLINGETGTGKELVARHIHTTSNRKNKPMVTVNCGAIPASLIESEFFGHAKGSFTGATAERKGRFQLAHGGTIFLDEIGELPLDLQVKILRVIQEGEFEPVGSSKTIKVDVRIIAATHRNLFELSKEGKFREDLYYRLNVFPIETPPLRERGDDVILIANTFIIKFGKRINKKIQPLTDQQMKILKSYSWPGNIRELQNIIERSVILAQNGILDLNTTLGIAKQSEETITTQVSDRILTKDEFLEFEKQNIIRALKAANWKVSGRDGAAALLKMVPSTLSSRINALGIKVPKD